MLQILSDCEFLTKRSALSICLLSSSYGPCRRKAICHCYPMKARERCDWSTTRLVHFTSPERSLNPRVVWTYCRRNKRYDPAGIRASDPL